MGQSPPGSTYRDSPEGLPFYQGKADFGPVHPSPRKWCVQPKKIAQPGDILISVRAPVGPTNIADVECCIGRGLAAVRARVGVDQRFLMHALNMIEADLVAQATGSTFQAITAKELRAVRLAVPDLEEQRRIADTMSIAERARSAASGQLAAVDELSAALLREIFPRSPAARLPRGWRSVTLGEVCNIVNGSTPRSGVEEYWNGDICWITPTDLSELESPYVSTSERTITQTGYDSCSTTLVPAGSVILSSRAPIGHLGIAVTSLCTNQGCKSFIPKDDLVSEFLYYALLHSVSDLRALGTGATFAEVSKRTLAGFRIAVGPAEEQRRITDQMRAVQRARASANSQLAALEDLSASLLKRLFSPTTG